jgi:hypothetical protein
MATMLNGVVCGSRVYSNAVFAAQDGSIELQKLQTARQCWRTGPPAWRRCRLECLGAQILQWHLMMSDEWFQKVNTGQVQVGARSMQMCNENNAHRLTPGAGR